MDIRHEQCRIGVRAKFEVLAMLQSIAKHYIAQRIHQELSFNLLADEAIVAVRCVFSGQKGREV